MPDEGCPRREVQKDRPHGHPASLATSRVVVFAKPWRLSTRLAAASSEASRLLSLPLAEAGCWPQELITGFIMY